MQWVKYGNSSPRFNRNSCFILLTTHQHGIPAFFRFYCYYVPHVQIIERKHKTLTHLPGDKLVQGVEEGVVHTVQGVGVDVVQEVGNTQGVEVHSF